MPKRILRALVGRDKPRRPKKSLPSYNEPTPETHRRLTREGEAELALKHTEFSPGVPMLLVSLFLLTIISVPAIQTITELSRHQAGHWLPMFEVLKLLPSSTQIKGVGSIRDAWHLLPRTEEIKAAEKTLETDSVVSQWLLPPVQSILTGKLRAGNEQVYLGRDGWLFYRPDVDYVTGPPFLDAKQLKHRAHTARIQPDPIRAILQFRDQLAARGIDLLVVPMPVKPSVEGEMLDALVARTAVLQNASFAEFRNQLSAAGIRVFDPAPFLIERKNSSNQPVYLQTDTHWRPDAMESFAQRLAAILNEESGENRLQVSNHEINGVGDVARMLKLPANETIYPAQKVTIRQVTNGNALWRPSSDADLLLLGDSFANIFSLEALGWGESAGFAEQLSLALGGRPLDCILRNSDGAFATREILAHELARGRDRLAGKKIVIWEFATRELAFGDWKLMDLQLGKTAASSFFSPKPGEEIEVTATIEVVSSVPRPGTVPYRDHVMALQLGDLALPARKDVETLQAVVYLMSMRDNVWTTAARLRPGDRVTLRLRAWADVSAQYEQINRSEIDDPAVQLEEPAWGELKP